MHLTDYHAKYFAHELTKRCASDSVEKLASTLVDAQVDLNPHPVCKWTLRRQVLAYVPFTKRHPLVQPFMPKESEDRLYHLVSDYLRRDNLQALPVSQRSLMTLVLRKLLASSTFAIAGALASLSRRLQAQLQQATETQNLEEELTQDFEALDAMAEEWEEGEAAPELLSKSERAAIKQEIADLERFRDLAVSITHNAKGEVLLTALQMAFAKTEELGAVRKAIVFTESRRTQDYLLRVLADSPYKDGVVLFNGSNNDDKSRQIYADWLHRHANTDRVTGSRTADMRSALVDYFHEQGQIMIATEAGAEGINLQFCSLVVNYDLLWNPQRIEQRIADIYQRCHTPEEINASFDQLRQELSQQINEAMARTRQQLFENFDEEVLESCASAGRIAGPTCIAMSRC